MVWSSFHVIMTFIRGQDVPEWRLEVGGQLCKRAKKTIFALDKPHLVALRCTDCSGENNNKVTFRCIEPAEQPDWWQRK